MERFKYQIKNQKIVVILILIYKNISVFSGASGQLFQNQINLNFYIDFKI